MKLNDKPTFTRTVTVRRPAGDGFLDEPFQATFNVLPVSVYRSFELGTMDGTRAFCVAVIADLTDIEGPDGKPIPYSEALRDQVLDDPLVPAAIFKTYSAALNEAVRGN